MPLDAGRRRGRQEVIDRTHAEPQGTIRLSAPPALIHYFLGELIARFMVKCPKVQVYLKSFSRPVDVLREGYDLAVRVRFGPIESSDLVMKPLGMSGQRLVAAPRWRAPWRCPRIQARSASCRRWRWASTDAKATGSWTGRTAPA